MEPAKDGGRLEDELSCTALQITRCGTASETQSPPGTFAALVGAHRGVHRRCGISAGRKELEAPQKPANFRPVEAPGEIRLTGNCYQRRRERVTGSWRASTIGALSLIDRAIMMKTQYLCASSAWRFSSF